MSGVITRKCRQWFDRKQPKLTTAEQQVLDAGGTWWETQLFSGKPDWQQLLQIPLNSLSAAEQAFLDHQVETLCQMLQPWQILLEKDLSNRVWEYIKREKFWGLVIPQEYQGLGFSAQAHSAIVSKIASRNVSAALSVMVPNSLGPAEIILHFGTDAQKSYYLPRLVKGEEVGCFALTSTIAGSDATSISDSGIVCEDDYQGERVLGIRLQFSKRYITLAPLTTLIVLAFQLSDPDQLLGGDEQVGITLAVVPATLVGVEQGLRHQPVHAAFPNGTLRGEDVFIPMSLVVGGQARCGQGWQMMLECLAVGRGISLPALATANAKVSCITTTAYARLRQQFNRPIGDFEGVQLPLARIVAKAFCCEAVRLFTAQAVDAGVRPAVSSAIAKYHLTELARDIINDAMDVHAGRAVQNGPQNYLLDFYDTVPVTVTVEGANILTRNLIIFGQGVMRCHPFIRQEVTSEDRYLPGLILRHIGFAIKNFCKSTLAGFTAGRCFTAKKPYRQLSRMSTAFALLSDMALLCLGKRLKISEALSARLGDVLSHLYIASAVLWYQAKILDCHAVARNDKEQEHDTAASHTQPDTKEAATAGDEQETVTASLRHCQRNKEQEYDTAASHTQLNTKEAATAGDEQETGTASLRYCERSKEQEHDTVTSHTQLDTKEAATAGDEQERVTASLRHYERSEAIQEDLADVVDWCVQHSLYQMQMACDDFLQNFPNRWLARLLRVCIFPYGRCYHYPADSLSVKIAKSMQQQSPLRQYFKQGCFIGDNSEFPIALVEQAWHSVVSGQADEALIKQALQVDEFRKG